MKAPDGALDFDSYGRTLRAGSSVRIFTNRQRADELVSACLRKNLEVSVRQVNLEDVFISEVGAKLDEPSDSA